MTKINTFLNFVQTCYCLVIIVTKSLIYSESSPCVTVLMQD